MLKETFGSQPHDAGVDNFSLDARLFRRAILLAR